MTEETGGSTVRDVLVAEPVIRRVITARVSNREDVDDLVHDCLERLLRARDRLASETVVPFGIVTAQHLVISHARTAARRAASPGVAERLEPVRPEDEVLAAETRAAMASALARLSAHERLDLLAYQEHGTRQAASGARRESPGALRVRMARTRAKLRLEYLVAFRGVQLPDPVCRPVLLAISGGDTRRQEALGAGEHLLGCPTCAGLNEALETRSLALTALAFPLAVLAWAVGKARAHPVSSGVGAVVAAGAVAAATLLPSTAPATRTTRPPAGRSLPSSTAPRRSPALATPPPARSTSDPVVGLSVRGSAVLASPSLRASAGQRAVAAEVTVQEVVTHDGFWVGDTPTARVWVELVGPLERLRIRRGDRLRFVGTVRADTSSYPASAGVADSTGAALLALEGAHLAVPTTTVVDDGP